MAYSYNQAREFISKIAPIIQKEAKARGYKVCSPIVAQAICESAAGTSSLGYKYHNYFGMKCGSSWKGKSVNLSTKEEYTAGTLTSIKANFRAYDSMEDGVKGYFDFIGSKRYANLKDATTYTQYLELIKADGYATSSTYVKTNSSIVQKYILTEWDNFGNGSATVIDLTTGNKYSKYTGTSIKIDDVLFACGVEEKYRGTWKNRKPLAEANGIRNYIGTYEQNILFVQICKDGKLTRITT